MKMSKECPLCGEPFDPEVDILCTNCGYVPAEESPSCDPEVTSDPHLLPENTILNKRYRIKRFLGQGGFGITYEGYDTLLMARVAIKEFYPSAIASRHISVSLNVNVTAHEEVQNYQRGLDSFLREAQNLARFIEEDDIVHVIDHFSENNTAYIVMEYVEGVTIAKYVEQNGTMSFSQCMKYIEPVMNALEIVHSKNMIHRDISPSNIMIRRNGRIKLLDFGAAGITDSASRSMSIIIKTGYTPIEQYSGSLQGPYTDIFALCGTIYYMLTGRGPESLYSRTIQKKALRRPSELGADITPEQERAVMKGLELNSKDRFQSIAELREALAGTGEKEPPVSPVPDRTQAVSPYHYARIILASLDVILIIGIIILLL